MYFKMIKGVCQCNGDGYLNTFFTYFPQIQIEFGATNFRYGNFNYFIILSLLHSRSTEIRVSSTVHF